MPFYTGSGASAPVCASIPVERQLADGTPGAASRLQPGLYFAHTDEQGAPAFENAMAAAYDAVAAPNAQLGARQATSRSVHG